MHRQCSHFCGHMDVCVDTWISFSVHAACLCLSVCPCARTLRSKQSFDFCSRWCTPMRPAKHKTAKPTHAVEPDTHCLYNAMDYTTLEANAAEHYEDSMRNVVTKYSSYTDPGDTMIRGLFWGFSSVILRNLLHVREELQQQDTFCLAVRQCCYCPV